MRYLIKAGCLIDGTGASPRERVDILFDERRIIAIDCRDAITDAEAAVIPALDKVVLPGLVDAHVHICFDASCDPVFNVRHEPPPDMLIRGAANARDMLMAGVTTIRTLGTPNDLDLHLRDGIRQGLIPGPRIVAAGRSLTVTGGHGYYYRMEADGPAEMREATRQQIRNGVNVIKITGDAIMPRHSRRATASWTSTSSGCSRPMARADERTIRRNSDAELSPVTTRRPPGTTTRTSSGSISKGCGRQVIASTQRTRSNELSRNGSIDMSAATGVRPAVLVSCKIGGLKSRPITELFAQRCRLTWPSPQPISSTPRPFTWPTDCATTDRM